MSTIPDKGPSLHPAMDNMTVTDNGVCKLLRNLNIQKASGPAEIPTRLTKEHAENLALISKCLEQHGLLTDAQHGIRKNRSCESQLILTVHDLAKEYGSRKPDRPYPSGLSPQPSIKYHTRD